MLSYRKLLIEHVQRTYRRRHHGQRLPEKLLEMECRKLSSDIRRTVKDILFIIVGVSAATFGLVGFLLPNNFIDGGVTGISLLVEVTTGVPLSVLLLAINLPFVVLGAKAVSRGFALKSVVSITLLAVLVHVAHFPPVTADKLLIAVFGGFFLGTGIGMTIRGGAVIDGTEVLAIWLSRRTSLTVGDIILVLNLIIFGFGAVVLSMGTALYAMLTYLSASKTVDFIIDGIEQYMGVTIISPYSEDIRLAIIEELGRGVTIYISKGGFGKRGQALKQQDVVYTVVTRLELSKLKAEVERIDPDAFVVMNVVKDAKGGIIKKRPLAH